jgi:hypothetical protein
MDKSNNGMFFLLLFGVAALFLFSRRSAVQQPYYEEPYYAPEPPPIPLRSIAISQNRITPRNSYDNEEVREITYNDDGLPTRIVIHRHAATS